MQKRMRGTIINETMALLQSKREMIVNTPDDGNARNWSVPVRSPRSGIPGSGVAIYRANPQPSMEQLRGRKAMIIYNRVSKILVNNATVLLW
jgi:hypothetical protein